MRLASVTKFGLMIASRVSTPWADTVIGTRVATKATIALASNARDQSDLRVMLVLLAILLVCQCPRRSGPARDGCRERRPAVCGPAGGAAPPARGGGVPGELGAPGGRGRARPGPRSAGLDRTAPPRRAGLAAPATVVRGEPRSAPGHDHRADHHHRGPDPGGDGSPLS